MAPRNANDAAVEEDASRRRKLTGEGNSVGDAAQVPTVSNDEARRRRIGLTAEENSARDAAQVSTAETESLISDSVKASEFADAPPMPVLPAVPPRKMISQDDPTSAVSETATPADASTEVVAEPFVSQDEPWYNVRSPINLEAKDESDPEQPWYNVRSPINLEAKDESDPEQPWYNVRSPINLEAKAESDPEQPWYNVRSPINLEAKDSAEGNDGNAAMRWKSAQNALALEAQEAKQFVIGAGHRLEALAGSDQLHLLVGGSLLLVAGVVVRFVRRARNRKAAEKQLEDETYLLMA